MDNKYILIVIGIFILGIIIGVSFDSNKCPDCNTEILQIRLNECTQNSKAMIDAWDEYRESLYDYCELDPYNLICLSLP